MEMFNVSEMGWHKFTILKVDTDIFMCFRFMSVVMKGLCRCHVALLTPPYTKVLVIFTYTTNCCWHFVHFYNGGKCKGTFYEDTKLDQTS